MLLHWWTSTLGAVVEYWTRNRELQVQLTPGPMQATLSKLLNLLCAQVNSACYPQPDGKWVVLGLVWLIGAMVCLLAAQWVQLSISAFNGWPHNALQHHWLMPISCHFRDRKALLVTSLTRLSGAITSVQTFTFTFSAVLQLVANCV